MIKMNTSVSLHECQGLPEMKWWAGHVTSFSPHPPPNSKLQDNFEKTYQTNPLSAILENRWSVLLKFIKVMENMAGQKPSETRGDQGDRSTRRNEVSWVGFWAKKSVAEQGAVSCSVVKILVESNKVWSSVVRTSVNFLSFDNVSQL